METPSESPLQSSPILLTYQQLTIIRRNFAALFLGLGTLFFCVNGVVRIFIDPTRFDESPYMRLSTVTVCLLIVPRLFIMALVFVYGRRLTMRDYLLMAIVSFIPLISWLACYRMVGYTPEHLKAEEADTNARFAPFPYWVVPGAFPLLAIGIMFGVNPAYMSQLFYGPPIGANIPGLPIPCGWPILIMIAMLIALGDFIVWVGFRRRLVQGVWLWFLTTQIVFFFGLPALWLSILGPAGIQMFKAFVLNQ